MALYIKSVNRSQIMFNSLINEGINRVLPQLKKKSVSEPIKLNKQK